MFRNGLYKHYLPACDLSGCRHSKVNHFTWGKSTGFHFTDCAALNYQNWVIDFGSLHAVFGANIRGIANPRSKKTAISHSEEVENNKSNLKSRKKYVLMLKKSVFLCEISGYLINFVFQ